MGNTFRDNSRGAAVCVTGNRNKLAGIKYQGSNGYAIKIAAGAQDTAIQDFDIPLSATYDEGTRTCFGNLSFNEGTPDAAGAWNGVANPRGIEIFDRMNGTLWRYDAGFNLSGSSCVRIGATAF